MANSDMADEVRDVFMTSVLTNIGSISHCLEAQLAREICGREALCIWVNLPCRYRFGLQASFIKVCDNTRYSWLSDQTFLRGVTLPTPGRAASHSLISETPAGSSVPLARYTSASSSIYFSARYWSSSYCP